MPRRRLLALALAGASACLATVGAGPASADTATPATNPDDLLVQSWYLDFLGRQDPADDPGRAYWVDMLDRGVSRQYVLGSIVRSDEYATKEVTQEYENRLLREPDPGARYWIDQTAHHDMAWEWVEQNLMASQEYRDRAASDADFVGHLYGDILARPAAPSSGEVAYWVDRYHRVGALGVVREIWYTDEAVRFRLRLNYEDLLGRQVDADGLAYWGPREQQSDITVQVALASTDEYAADAVEAFG